MQLSDVNLFYWPGPKSSGSGELVKSDVPLNESAGGSDLEAIMSNRRFRKVLQQLGESDREVAGRMVQRELSGAIEEYEPLYAESMARFTPHYKLSQLAQTNILAGPGFEIENVPEGKIVIAGARLKVLSLVWGEIA